MANPNSSYKSPTRMENMMGLGAMGAGLGGLLGQGLGHQDLMGAASPYLQQMQGNTEKYMNPYINAGQGAMGTLQGQYQNLLSNPGQMYNQMGAGYQQSPGYQHNVDEMSRAIGNSASAGGYGGSLMHQNELAKNIHGLANQDYMQYMQNMLGMYGQGLQGMGNVNQMGYNASTNAANTLNDMLAKQASLAYNSAANEQSSSGGMGAGLGGLLGGAAGFFSPIPGGTAMGSKLGGIFGDWFS
jgi:hypothetical protein